MLLRGGRQRACSGRRRARRERRDSNAAEQGPIQRVEHGRRSKDRTKGAADVGEADRRHQDPSGSEGSDNCQIENGGCKHERARARGPKVSRLTYEIYGCLTCGHEHHEDESRRSDERTRNEQPEPDEPSTSFVTTSRARRGDDRFSPYSGTWFDSYAKGEPAPGFRAFRVSLLVTLDL